MRSTFDRGASARFWGLALLIAGTTQLSAQELGTLALVDPASFTERFSGNTKVSGQLLAGLSYKSLSNELDPAQIGLASSPSRVCVQLTTEDGRYWASNLFGHSESSASPSRLSFSTAYLSQLKSYPPSGLLVLAMQTDDCADLSGQRLIPGILGELDEEAALLAYVNVSQGRATAWLEQDGVPTAEPTSCERPDDGAKVTYSNVCSILIDSNIPAGEYDLNIAVRSLTGGRIQESYRVVVD